jgi:imidazolonepropionase-like amidohydrolase
MGRTSGDKTRTIFRNGLVIDPATGFEGLCDLAVEDGVICARSPELPISADDRVLDCDGLIVMPGLFDLHLHLGDLFDIYERPMFQAIRDGVTTGLSPGAGNTFMAPALLGAEVDRGIPIHAGVYLGAAAVLGTRLGVDELVSFFQGQLDEAQIWQNLSRNGITNTTGQMTVGIKDHMGHFIMADAAIDALFEVSSRAGLIYMSHTQDPEHAQRMASLSNGRPLHLGHVTAAGCGTHGDGSKAMETTLTLIDGEQITGEFVSSMLLENQGRRDGLKMTRAAQTAAYKALQDGRVDIIVSDGQSGATMKGFGCTADNLPCIFTLARLGVLSMKEAVGCITWNPVRLMSRRTGNRFFAENLGHLGVGALANITVADPVRELCVFTMVNGQIAAFEGNIVREGASAGCLVSRFGFHTRTGVGDLAMYSQWNS